MTQKNEDLKSAKEANFELLNQKIDALELEKTQLETKLLEMTVIDSEPEQLKQQIRLLDERLIQK